jgi:exopolyphosphatase/guanosine-5'-triphosphate,3'-diphosphate pyrophosphatase
MLGHVDAPGFSQSQQRRLAELVLAQRGGLRKVEFSLKQPDFAWQALCLRLAIIKCHARGAIDSHAIALRGQGTLATLSWQPGWHESHPHTLYLLNEEVAAWQRSTALQLELPRMAEA